MLFGRRTCGTRSARHEEVKMFVGVVNFQFCAVTVGAFLKVFAS